MGSTKYTSCAAWMAGGRSQQGGDSPGKNLAPVFENAAILKIMPLTEPSSLETALSRIVGEPATSAGTAPPADQGTFNLAPRSSLISYSPNTATSVGGMSTNLGAAQPVSTAPAMPVSQAPAITSPAPVAAPTAAAPQITYEQQMRNDLAFSGITGPQADQIVSGALAGQGFTSATPYDPTSTAQNPYGIPAGQASVTTAGGAPVYKSVPNIYGPTAAAPSATTPSRQERYAERRY
jgi:hypothetical protein